MSELYDAVMKAIDPLRVSVDSKQPIPDTSALSGDNGVRMPGPDNGRDEAGFDAVGEDMRGVNRGSFGPGGVRLAGAPATDEAGWHFGEDQSDASRPQDNAPKTNQDFGAESDHGSLEGMGDMAVNAQIFGSVGSNTSGINPADIGRVFDAIAGNGRHGGVMEMSDPAMRGLLLGAGSGPVGSWDAGSGDSDNDGY